MTNTTQYDSRVTPTWCPGCGNFGIFEALKLALNQLHYSFSDICLFYDIGCASNMISFLKTNGFNGLHGRSLPAAVGAAIANHQYPIIAFSGDGGAYGEGLNHLIEACRANYKITYLVSNNQLYSLTTGQRSPTTAYGQKTKSTPFGNLELPFNPLSTAIVNHATFVSRGFSGEIDHLTKLIVKALKNPGFSLVDILSPCVTWNKTQPWDWYRKKVYQLKHDGYPKNEALKLAMEGGEKFPLGIFYQEKRKTYQSLLPQLKDKPLIDQEINNINISKLIEEFI